MSDVENKRSSGPANDSRDDGRNVDVSGTPPPPGEGDWRDPAIFGPLETRIETERGTKPRSTPRRGRKAEAPLSPVRTKQLKAFLQSQIAPVSQFMLECCAAQMRHRPNAFKNYVVACIRKELPPKPRKPGRPRKDELTKAMKLKAEQEREVREGKRKRIDWDEIAAKCIPGYSDLRFPWQNAQVRKRLRNSVRAREHRGSWNLRHTV